MDEIISRIQKKMTNVPLQTAPKRNTNIEFLRILMMLLIVIMHFSGGSVDINLLTQQGGPESAWFWGYRIITHIGVPTFAFISGYFGIKLNIRKALDLEIMAITYGFIVIILAILCHHKIGATEILQLLLPISSGFLWYYSCYMLLMFISPILNEGVKKINIECFTCIISILLPICFAGRFMLNANSCTLLTLLVIYLIGQYLRKYKNRLIIIYRYYIFFISLVLNILTTSILGYLGKNIVFFLDGSNNPLTILSSISLFFIFHEMKKENTIISYMSKIAPYMLAVYILHESIRVLGIVDISILNGQLKLVIPTAIITVLTISLIEFCRQYLYDKIKKRITKDL